MKDGKTICDNRMITHATEKLTFWDNPERGRRGPLMAYAE